MSEDKAASETKAAAEKISADADKNAKDKEQTAKTTKAAADADANAKASAGAAGAGASVKAGVTAPAADDPATAAADAEAEKTKNEETKKKWRIFLIVFTVLVGLFVAAGVFVYVDKPHYRGLPEILAKMGLPSPVESITQKCQDALNTVEELRGVAQNAPGTVKWADVNKARWVLSECYEHETEQEQAKKGLGLVIEIYIIGGDNDTSRISAKSNYETALEIAQKIEDNTLINQIRQKIDKIK